jgi:predicted component of type VI protein secretion system
MKSLRAVRSFQSTSTEFNLASCIQAFPVQAAGELSSEELVCRNRIFRDLFPLKQTDKPVITGSREAGLNQPGSADQSSSEADS